MNANIGDHSARVLNCQEDLRLMPVRPVAESNQPESEEDRLHSYRSNSHPDECRSQGDQKPGSKIGFLPFNQLIQPLFGLWHRPFA
jgi:hypothetical protein